jgi:hypothetical protein
MKRILIGLGIAVLIVLGLFQYLHQPHRDIAEEEAVTTITAEKLALYFVNKPEAALATYLNKTLIVTGSITEIDNAGIVLDKSAYVQFKKVAEMVSLKMQEPLSLKGRCIGYDELLELVKFDQCIIIK